MLNRIKLLLLLFNTEKDFLLSNYSDLNKKGIEIKPYLVSDFGILQDYFSDNFKSNNCSLIILNKKMFEISLDFYHTKIGRKSPLKYEEK